MRADTRSRSRTLCALLVLLAVAGGCAATRGTPAAATSTTDRCAAFACER